MSFPWSLFFFIIISSAEGQRTCVSIVAEGRKKERKRETVTYWHDPLFMTVLGTCVFLFQVKWLPSRVPFLLLFTTMLPLLKNSEWSCREIRRRRCWWPLPINTSPAPSCSRMVAYRLLQSMYEEQAKKKNNVLAAYIFFFLSPFQLYCCQDDYQPALQNFLFFLPRKKIYSRAFENCHFIHRAVSSLSTSHSHSERRDFMFSCKFSYWDAAAGACHGRHRLRRAHYPTRTTAGAV